MALNGRDYERSESEDEAAPQDPQPVLGAEAIQDSLDGLNNSVYDDVDDTVGYCTECKNVLPDSKFGNSPFFQQGGNVPCMYCGGVTVIVRQRFINEGLNENLDRSRGLGSTRHVG